MREQAELTPESWWKELSKKLKPNGTIKGPFFTAYKNYIYEWGCAKFVKGTGNAGHQRRRDAAAARMHELNSSFKLDRATGRANTLYNNWSPKASANSRAKAEREERERRKSDADMGGRGGTDALSHESGHGTSRRSRGRRED